MPVEYRVSDESRIEAVRIAELRLSDTSRHLSRHRPTARNLTSQVRGALGELYACQWLSDNDLEVETGFREDLVGSCDIDVGGRRIEVMTAKISDREKTQFCVPPGKLKAARNRGAWGYLFVGTDDARDCQVVTIQGGIELHRIEAFPRAMTYVSRPEFAVENHVIPHASLLTPDDVLAMLKSPAPNK